MTPTIQVGTIVRAKRYAGIAQAGEIGVCYEVYTLGARPGWSFIFERGGYDGFSPDEVALCLEVGWSIDPATAVYEFENVTHLLEDFRAGRFAKAFAAGRDPVDPAHEAR